MSETDIDYTIHYRRFHDGSEKNWQNMARHFQTSLAPFLPANKDALILDIGCGYGFGLMALRNAGYTNVVGIDSDPGQVAMAKSKGLDARLVPVEDTSSFLRSLAGSVALVYAFDVLEHVPHEAQIPLCRDINMALRPGALLICRTPNAMSPVAMYGRYVDWTHKCVFTRESFEFVYRNAGFDVVSIGPAPEAGSGRGPVASAIVWLLRLPLRLAARGLWRMILMSELGIGYGLREAITPNILAVARKPS